MIRILKDIRNEKFSNCEYLQGEGIKQAYGVNLPFEQKLASFSRRNTKGLYCGLLFKTFQF